MTTAIDTNVLLDLLIPNEAFYDASAAALEESSAGLMVVCEIVYAELSVHFEDQAECDEFLETNDIRVEPLTRKAGFLAGRAWRMYRRSGGKRTRIITDFLIGAHAQEQATRLVSRDRGFYRELFPSLTVFDPSSTGLAK
jgi:predicted nucleic acid-binding protein